MFFLDTDIATLVFRKQDRVLARLATVAADRIAFTLVTWLEVLRGRIEAIIKAATAAELLAAVDGLQKSETFLTQFLLVPITDAVAAQFEQLRANKKLNKMDSGDRLQAALALSHGATLVTRNTKDYAHVPNLKLDNWAA